MFIGIDVGGTFTDAVAVDEGRILASAKHPTVHENLLKGILAGLDDILPAVGQKQIERVTLSATVVTNQVVEGREEPVDIYVIPGPGMNIDQAFPVPPIVLKGYTDHRGAVTKEWDKEELKRILQSHSAQTAEQLSHQNADQVADQFADKSSHQAADQSTRQFSHKAKAVASAKFAVRNPKEEQELKKALQNGGYDVVSAGAELSGALNFPRRTVSAYYNSAVQDGFSAFRQAVEEALAQRQITAPLYILKADGGSLPMATVAARPVETVFTGPAASVLGMQALTDMPMEAVAALDIGGTTTDISLWEKGQPLMARGGVTIKGWPSAVRAFQVTSVGIGGDSALGVSSELTVGPRRLGPSMCLGGPVPTLGDALVVLGAAEYGDKKLALAAMTQIGEALQISPVEAAQLAVDTAVGIITDGIAAAVRRENKRPVYVVRDIVEPRTFTPARLVAVGGTADSLAPFVARCMEIPFMIPPSAPVANAVGAAVSKGTTEITVRVDTNKQTLVIPELGIRENRCQAARLDEVRRIAAETVAAEKERLGIQEAGEGEIIFEEDFPVVQGWSSMSHLITVRMQLKAGVRYDVR